MTAPLDLAATMPRVARALLGDPVAHLSTAAEWRYGRRGSLAIDVKRGLWCDHEAASGGGVIDLIRRERGGDVQAALRWLNEASETFAASPMRARSEALPCGRAGRDDGKRMSDALRIWHGAKPPAGTLAEAYLAGRGLSLDLLGNDPGDRIRFAPACPFGPGERRPAMLALLTDMASGQATGIRRTALALAGARACDAGGAKLPHKALGVARGAVARLAGGDVAPAHLALCEGLETGLSVMAATGAMTGATVWACLSAGTLAKVPPLAGVERLTIYADHDPPGLHAARETARRWAAAGRLVTVETPSRAGADFNDIWKEAHHG